MQLRSVPLDKGGEFSCLFTEPGTYSYSCTYHPPDMVGEIIVE
jgi:plastocyanin